MKVSKFKVFNVLFVIILYGFNSIAFDCKEAIYNSISLNIQNIEPTQSFFDKIDSLPHDLYSNFYFRRIQKIGGDIYYQPLADWDHAKRLYTYLNFIMKHKDEIGDLDIVVALFDEHRSYINLDYNSKFFYDGPIFTFGYTNADKNLFNGKNQFVLVPDPFILSQEKYDDNIKKLLTNEESFVNTNNKILFRGQLNIGTYPIYKETMWANPRVKIFMMGLLFPDKIDAKLVGENLILHKIADPKMRDLWEEMFYNDKNDPTNQRFALSHSEQQQYKYILSLDGNGPSSTRPQLISLMNSLLMYQTDYVQWFSSAMIPNYNYLPIKSDLSNLLEQYDWAEKNEKQVKEIIKNQKTTAMQCFMPDQVDQQFLFTLQEYSKKIKYQVKPKKNFIKITEYLSLDGLK